MKILFFFFGFAFFIPAPALLVIDMDGKRTPRPATEFSMALYFGRSFPIYADDLSAVINATEEAAKCINRHHRCNSLDTVRANRTLVIVKTACNDGEKVTVRLVSRIQEQKSLFDFELVKGEADLRKAQIKLLDFAAYLAQ